MGLWKFLTKPIYLPGTLLGWKEPLFWGSRLRGDLHRWVLSVVAFFMIGTGALLVFNGIVMHAGWAGVALAVMIGGLIVSFIGTQLIRRRDNMSGKVQIKKAGIRRVRSYSSIAFHATILTTETQEWPYGAITGCQLIPSTALGKSFSLLAVATDDSMDVIAVPHSINLKELVTRLQEGGVAVSLGQSVPSKYTKTCFNSPLLIPFAVTSAAVMLVGLVLSLGSGAGAVNQGQAERADLTPQRALMQRMMEESQKASEERRSLMSGQGLPSPPAIPVTMSGTPASPKAPPPPPPPPPPASGTTNQETTPPNNAAPGKPPRMRPSFSHPAFPQGGHFPGPPIPGPPGAPAP